MDDNDRQWAIEQLEAWVGLAEEYQIAATRTGGVTHRTALAAKIFTGQAQVERIIRRVYPSYTARLVTIHAVDSSIMAVGEGVQQARRTIGELTTQGEAIRRLGSSAPRMSADALHPAVWEAASRLWEDGHHGLAVQRAATFLSAHVQDRVDRHDVSDAQLMQQVLSAAPPEDAKARLRWPGEDSDQSVRSMREGLRGFGPGCFQSIRNLVTHQTQDPPQQQCLESLAALSLLARWIDECVVVRASV